MSGLPTRTIKKYRRGTPILAKDLNILVDQVKKANRISGSKGLRIHSNATGHSFTLDEKLPFYARITDNREVVIRGNTYTQYAWYEVTRTVDGVFDKVEINGRNSGEDEDLDEGSSSSGENFIRPAYELNDKEVTNGTIVRLYPGLNSNYHFSVGGDAKIRHARIICTYPCNKYKIRFIKRTPEGSSSSSDSSSSNQEGNEECADVNVREDLLTTMCHANDDEGFETILNCTHFEEEELPETDIAYDITTAAYAIGTNVIVAFIDKQWWIIRAGKQMKKLTVITDLKCNDDGGLEVCTREIFLPPESIICTESCPDGFHSSSGA